MIHNKVLSEIFSLMRWSILAACTVGPGTVVTCAKAGYEQGLELIWALIFATILAYIMQEGSARLTITSGMSMGECLRTKYSGTRFKPLDAAIICWVISGAVFIGNTLYQCNNYGGGVVAVYSLPPVEETVEWRVGCVLVFTLIVSSLLYLDKTDNLSFALGVLMMGMIALFWIVNAKLGLDWQRFGWGLLPSFPANSANLIISLVGTTSIGFNIFLGSFLAEGENLGKAQRGIAFAVMASLVVSVLIMIIGDGVEKVEDQDGSAFTILYMADLIEEAVGIPGLWVFGIGFIAAAISSVITVALAAALTCDSMLGERKDETNQDEEGQKQREIDNHHLPTWLYYGIMFFTLAVATIVIGAGAPSEKVIEVAQVFNGCLLPVFSTCLLICLNDENIMKKRPQKWWSNVFMVISVLMTNILAFNAFLANVFKGYIDETPRLIIAGVGSPIVLLIVCVSTSLGKDMLRSFRVRV